MKKSIILFLAAALVLPAGYALAVPGSSTPLGFAPVAVGSNPDNLSVCNKCGEINSAGAKTCVKCGAAVFPPDYRYSNASYRSPVGSVLLHLLGVGMLPWGYANSDDWPRFWIHAAIGIGLATQAKMQDPLSAWDVLFALHWAYILVETPIRTVIRNGRLREENYMADRLRAGMDTVASRGTTFRQPATGLLNVGWSWEF